MTHRELGDLFLQRAVRLAAICSWIMLTVLSLLPGSDRPHTGLSGNAEHMMAYLLAALVTRLAFRQAESRWQLIAFSAAAAFFEVCQIWIPGRHAGIDNWAASSAAALIGIVTARIVCHHIERSTRLLHLWK